LGNVTRRGWQRPEQTAAGKKQKRKKGDNGSGEAGKAHGAKRGEFQSAKKKAGKE